MLICFFMLTLCCTILLVTHDNRILDIADRIVYMDDGRLEKKGK